MYNKELPLQEVNYDIQREHNEREKLKKNIIASIILEKDYIKEENKIKKRRPTIH